MKVNLAVDNLMQLCCTAFLSCHLVKQCMMLLQVVLLCRDARLKGIFKTGLDDLPDLAVLASILHTKEIELQQNEPLQLKDVAAVYAHLSVGGDEASLLPAASPGTSPGISHGTSPGTSLDTSPDTSPDTSGQEHYKRPLDPKTELFCLAAKVLEDAVGAGRENCSSLSSSTVVAASASSSQARNSASLPVTSNNHPSSNRVKEWGHQDEAHIAQIMSQPCSTIAAAAGPASTHRVVLPASVTSSIEDSVHERQIGCRPLVLGDFVGVMCHLMATRLTQQGSQFIPEALLRSWTVWLLSQSSGSDNSISSQGGVNFSGCFTQQQAMNPRLATAAAGGEHSGISPSQLEVPRTPSGKVTMVAADAAAIAAAGGEHSGISPSQLEVPSTPSGKVTMVAADAAAIAAATPAMTDFVSAITLMANVKMSPCYKDINPIYGQLYKRRSELRVDDALRILRAMVKSQVSCCC
jgi:hypothetical protein